MKYNVLVLGWESPSAADVVTGSGMYINYLSKLGRFSRSRDPKVDLTFVVPSERDNLTQKRGYKVLSVKTPGFRGNRRYEEDVLYPSAKHLTDRLLSKRSPIHLEKFDVVLVNGFAFGDLLSKASHLDNFVYISHRPEFLRGKIARQFKVELVNHRRLKKDTELEDKSVKNSRRVITVSRACKKEFARRYKQSMIDVIYNGVDVGVFKRVKAPRNGKKVFTYVGRNHLEKGVNLILKAASELDWAHEKDVELRAITDDGVSLRREIVELGLARRVKLIGWRKFQDLSQYYSSSTFTIMPSYWESFSYVTAESMACGTPAIVSTAGALPELVDRTTGLLFSIGNEHELARKLEEACSHDPRRVEEMGKRGRKRIEQSFSKEMFLERYLRFIDGFVNNTLPS